MARKTRAPSKPRHAPASVGGLKLAFQQFQANALDGAAVGSKVLGRLSRARIPGGWIVLYEERNAFFVPDVNGRWADPFEHQDKWLAELAASLKAEEEARS